MMTSYPAIVKRRKSPAFLMRELCVMKSHRRVKMARLSNSYISGDVYHVAGRALTGDCLAGKPSTALPEEALSPPKPK